MANSKDLNKMLDCKFISGKHKGYSLRHVMLSDVNYVKKGINSNSERSPFNKIPKFRDFKKYCNDKEGAFDFILNALKLEDELKMIKDKISHNKIYEDPASYF